MSSPPYFDHQSLRERFTRHAQQAFASGAISAAEYHCISHPDSAALRDVADAPQFQTLTLEDGSPVPLGLASAWLIVRRQAQGETLFLDTLALGLERFHDRSSLMLRLRQLFAIRPDLEPSFEYQSMQGPPFVQRMLSIVSHPVSTLAALASELDKLPPLSDAVDAVLKPRMQRFWPGETVDLHAPVVQIVQSDKSAAGASGGYVLRVETAQQMALDALTGNALSAGQSQRVLDQQGQPLKAVSDALFMIRPADLKDDYERLLADYWVTADAQGVSRRDRAAQLIADGFLHHALQWQALHPTDADVWSLLQPGIQPLSALGPQPARRLSISQGEQGPFKLVSLYLLDTSAGHYLLYSPFKGLRRVVDWVALENLFNSTTGRREVAHYLSLDDQALLDGAQYLHVQGYPLTGPLFLDCIDAIIAGQKRNLGAALERDSRELAELCAMLDDALDMRVLIDPRLPAFQLGGRWSREPSAFIDSWPAVARPELQAGEELSLSWMEKVTLLDSMLGTLDGLRPGLETLAGRALAPWLAVQGFSDLSHVEDIWIDPRVQETGNSEDNQLPMLPSDAHGGAAQGVAPQRLIAVLLERLTGRQREALPKGCELLQYQPGSDAVIMRQPVAGELLEYFLQQAVIGLTALCTTSVKTFYTVAQRRSNEQLLAGSIMGLMHEDLLRLELEVLMRLRRFAPAQVAMLQQVLDRPLRSLRPAGDDMTEIQALVLHIADREVRMPLSCAWVIQQPERPQLGLLFWSPFTGVEVLPSLAHLQSSLQQLLARPGQRGKWLELFASQDSEWLDRRFAVADPPDVRLTLSSVDGDFIEQLQQEAWRLQQRDIDHQLQRAQREKLSAAMAGRCIDLAGSTEQQLVWLDAVAIRIQNMLFSTVLPDWLSKAPDAELERYACLLMAYYSNGDPQEDFLSDIPPLRNFARDRLLEALRRDFADQHLEPQNITLTMTQYIAAPVAPGSIPSAIAAATLVSNETLVDFALNHFSRTQDATLSVSLSDGAALPAGLTAGYLASLVHLLDVGQRYQTLLVTRFDPTGSGHAQRRERFMRQIPARLLLPALEMKLQGQLSAQAFDYLSCVMDMPDGKARQQVDGQDIVIQPLTLVPRPDMAADPVKGLFVIGPRDISKGPVVLHTLFNDWFSLREYRNREELLAQMRTAGPLNTLVLDRVDPLLRKRYDHGGLIEAHIPWSTEGFLDLPMGTPEQVSLGTEVVEGNALYCLFDATLLLLQHLSRKQSVTSAQADWASFVYVATLGAEQVLSFLPGKLGFLVAAWQSRSLLRESAGAIAEQRWGKALSEFSAALGMLVMARREQSELTRSGMHAQLPVFSWRNSALTADVVLRLRQFEVQDIELASLEYDELYNLYHKPGTQTLYAAVTGKVYRVDQHDGVWRIKGSGADGPKIRLNQSQQWELDLELGLRGGGDSIQMNVEQRLQNKAAQYMTIQARGMEQIRVLSRQQARLIGLARHQALGYLERALFNLNAPFAEGLPAVVSGLLKDFFGVQQPGSVLIDSLRSRIDELFMGLSEPSLSLLDSQRFVTGIIKPGYEDMAAFVIGTDPQQRVFLGDMFFNPAVHGLRQDSQHRAFSAEDHFRAVALLHELSHLVSKTQDIAYLDASAPPHELLDVSGPRGVTYQQALQHLRETALSHRTPRRRLFQTRDVNGWRDMVSGDGTVFATILRLTGQPTLDAARNAFLRDIDVRRRVILANADSVVMLVALLGRERFS